MKTNTLENAVIHPYSVLRSLLTCESCQIAVREEVDLTALPYPNFANAASPLDPLWIPSPEVMLIDQRSLIPHPLRPALPFAPRLSLNSKPRRSRSHFTSSTFFRSSGSDFPNLQSSSSVLNPQPHDSYSTPNLGTSVSRSTLFLTKDSQPYSLSHQSTLQFQNR